MQSGARIFIASILLSAPALPSETDALAIAANIQARHLPYGAILDPVFASGTSDQIVGYTRCGDSALWTGAYLAAEAFRYKVTNDPAALANVTNAIAAIKGLADVTGNNLLARCMVPVNSPYAAGIASEENANGIYTNSSAGWIWVGNTSRDQYIGAIFGLGIAYDMVGDPAIQSSISDLVTRLETFLTGHGWSVVMPDGSSSTSFLVRPEEMLSLIQVGRHVNAGHFGTYYNELRILLSPTLLAPVTVDIVDDNSYFKFNLDYMTFYNLMRLESSSARSVYGAAYAVVRNHTAAHQNAFFDIVDRGLNGPDATRDAETIALLDQWLQRPRRDFYVDLSNSVAVCGSQACNPIPVPLRTPTDFLWQRSPFQLQGGLLGTIETAGIDYTLPYWMARYYGVIGTFTVKSSAANIATVAPQSLATIYGTNLASQTGQGVAVTVTDSQGTPRPAALSYVSPSQINFQVPAGTAPGLAAFTVSNGGAIQSATGLVANVAPSLFSMNGNGSGVAAATAVRVQAGNPQLQSNVPVFQCGASGCTAVPISLGAGTPVYLTLYGTGIRNRSSLANVKVTIGGVDAPAAYAGAQPDFPGLDQVNVPLSLALQGKGEIPITVTADGQISNAVTIKIQ